MGAPKRKEIYLSEYNKWLLITPSSKIWAMNLRIHIIQVDYANSSFCGCNVVLTLCGEIEMLTRRACRVLEMLRENLFNNSTSIYMVPWCLS